MLFPEFSLGSPRLWGNTGLLILAAVVIAVLSVVAYQTLKATTPFARAMVVVAVVMTVFTATPNAYKFLLILVGVLGYVGWAWWQGRHAQCQCGGNVTPNGEHCPCGNQIPSSN